MPLTASQATQRNIANSLKDFISTNIITPYNTSVANTNYPAECSFGLAFPDDPDVYIGVPRIIMEMPLHDTGTVQGTGMGDGLVLRNKTVFFSVYPAITTDGKPSVQAMDVMMSLFDYAMGTALYVPIYDYSTSPKSLVDTMQIVSPKLLRPKGYIDPTLSLERHRFDYILTIRYSQVAING